ncbi:hypothetical protein [uncultured Pseudophaeobacter sp.]|jgi:hypothetical protein|uniref:hypothetical protein n=1 Tax=uncultured Pseudophaeobacter sp. TaxID=1759421 RepID=UPI0025E7291A|nr:hypothetical protein [uncultured Pseudophaeobacter sp.]
MQQEIEFKQRLTAKIESDLKTVKIETSVDLTAKTGGKIVLRDFVFTRAGQFSLKEIEKRSHVGKVQVTSKSSQDALAAARGLLSEKRPVNWVVDLLKKDVKIFEFPSVTRSYSERCRTCSGVGETKCSSCAGAGSTHCYQCVSGRQKCTACTNGRHKCSSCNGQRQKQVSKTKITNHWDGKVSSHVVYENVTCSGCGGSGQGGYCTNCGGRGQKTCFSCQGTSKNTCTTCHGSGKTKCRDCTNGTIYTELSIHQVATLKETLHSEQMPDFDTETKETPGFLESTMARHPRNLVVDNTNGRFKYHATAYSGQWVGPDGTCYGKIGDVGERVKFSKRALKIVSKSALSALFDRDFGLLKKTPLGLDLLSSLSSSKAGALVVKYDTDGELIREIELIRRGILSDINRLRFTHSCLIAVLAFGLGLAANLFPEVDRRTLLYMAAGVVLILVGVTFHSWKQRKKRILKAMGLPALKTTPIWQLSLLFVGNLGFLTGHGIGVSSPWSEWTNGAVSGPQTCIYRYDLDVLTCPLFDLSNVWLDG